VSSHSLPPPPPLLPSPSIYIYVYIFQQDKHPGPSLELLVSLGVEPGGTGSSGDGARVLPTSHIPVVLDGKVVGGCPSHTAIHVVEALRLMKVEAYEVSE